jgi:hypothetical protein
MGVLSNSLKACEVIGVIEGEEELLKSKGEELFPIRS